MIEIKKTNFLLSLLAALIIGIVLGYVIAGTKSPVTKIQYVNNNNSNLASNAITKRKVEIVNLTANEAVDVSYSEALSWAEDATLYEVTLESKFLDLQGQSNSWKINYYSKEKESSYSVVIVNGESRGGGEKVSNLLQTLKGEMIDSSKLAGSFYASYPETTEIINLKMYFDNGSKKFIWTIFFTGGSHTINAEI